MSGVTSISLENRRSGYGSKVEVYGRTGPAGARQEASEDLQLTIRLDPSHLDSGLIRWGDHRIVHLPMHTKRTDVGKSSRLQFCTAIYLTYIWARHFSTARV